MLADELPADGVVTGLGTIDGRQVAVMANDPTVKAGSWGARTVEKIIRIQETAARIRVPLFYLVDSAGARITDQIDMFPGRRHAGRIFFNEVQLSGQVPQICLLFGPSAAGGAYIPAFCDVVIMVEGNASMYLGSPRMVEVVVGEKVSLEELGGARMHCTESGCGDALVADDKEAIEFARAYFQLMPQRSGEKPLPSRPRRHAPAKPIADLIPAEAEPRLRHAQGDRRADRRGQLGRDQEALRQGAAHRAWRGSTGRRSASSPTSRCRRAACCSATRPTRPRASSGCATRSRSRCCSWPTCPVS